MPGRWRSLGCRSSCPPPIRSPLDAWSYSSKNVVLCRQRSGAPVPQSRSVGGAGTELVEYAVDAAALDAKIASILVRGDSDTGGYSDASSR